MHSQVGNKNDVKNHHDEARAHIKQKTTTTKKQFTQTEEGGGGNADKKKHSHDD